MANMGNLSHMDYKSHAAQIADAQRRQNGKTISWTGRLATAADGGPDWMEFSVLGDPTETMILRLDGHGITLLPQPAPAANGRMGAAS